MISWLKRTWMILAVVVANMVIFGPGARYVVAWFGNDFDDIAMVIFNLASCFLAILLTDLLFDRRKDWGIFPTLDIDAALKMAQKTPIGSALVWIGYVVLFAAVLLIAVPRAHADVLDNASLYLPKLTSAIDTHWPGMPLRHIPAGQVEKESGWNVRATLKTPRELGRGLVQPTISWDKRGKERFNAYKDAMAYKAMRGWNWRNDPYNAGYQLKLLVLRDRDAFRQVRPFVVNDEESMKITLVCYNAGEGRYLARKKYARLHGFAADRWSGGLELAHSPKENARLYGRPLFQAVNEYPRRIFDMAGKYKGLV